VAVVSNKLQGFYRDVVHLTGLEIEQYDQNLGDLIVFFNLEPSNLDEDTLVLKLCRVLEQFDVSEFRLSMECLERVMAICEHPPYPLFRLLYFCANMVKGRSGFYVSSRQFPNLTNMIYSIERCEQSIERMEVMRTQVFDQLMAIDEKNIPPISERLLQLNVLFSAYELLEDQDHEVYNQIVRTARQMFSKLSFQHVIRLCQNINDIVHKGDQYRMIMVQHVEKRLSLNLGTDLIKRLLQMKEKSVSQSEGWNNWIEHFVKGLRLKPDEMYRLVFFHTREHSVVSEQCSVVSTSVPISFDLVEGKAVIGSKGSERYRLSEHKGVLEIEERNGNDIKKYRIKSSEMETIGKIDFLYRSDLHECAMMPLIDDGLFLSNIDLHYAGNHILKSISAVVRRGEMMAVVGPSGCGKSTMLTMLAGLLEYTKGSIIFNGRAVSTLEDFSKISTYIPQDDILFRELTVHESVESSLRLKVKGDEKALEERIRSTIDVLGLERTEFLKIGIEGEKGISGGQRKRVNIGTTIVADMKPILLFDEPTSGLDPATDVEIMQLLRQLSRKGHIVICVTHNLSSESMAYFDKLMVLDKNGKQQFLGKELRAKYFFNIRSTHLLFNKMKEEQQQNYASRFAKTAEYQDIINEAQQMSDRYIGVKKSVELDQIKDDERRPNIISNFYNFYKRELRRKSRDLIFLSMCGLQPILIGVFISWNFSGPMPNAIFSILAATLWIGAISGVREINTEMPQLKRDYLYGTSLVGFLCSKVLSCFCFSFFQVCVMAHLIFLWDGYWREPFEFGYVSSLGMLCLLNLFGVSLGLFLSSAIRSALAAVGLLPVLLIPLLIMGGALIRHNQTDGLQWTAMKLNPLRISFESMLFSANRVLRPSLEKRVERDASTLEQQKVLLAQYQEQSALFLKDPDAYRKRYVEEDINDLFSDALSGVEDKKEDIDVPQPSPDLVESELLTHRQDLWLEGQALMAVDHPKSEKRWSYQHHFEIESPKAFSQKISVQGATGMFLDRDGQAWSIYRPLDYILYPLIETLLLWLAMYMCLKNRLSRKS